LLRPEGMSARILLAWQLVFAICAVAQDKGTPPAGIQKRQIDLTHAVPLPSIPMTGTTAYPFTCSSDGDVYAGVFVLDQEGRAVSKIPDFYKVSPHAEVKHLPKPLPTAYKGLDSPGFFAGDRMLVSVIRASRPYDQPTRVGSDYFLSVTDSDGDHPRLLRLDLRFSVLKAAVFGSGEFIVFGSDPATSDPVIALVNADGEFRRFIELPELPRHEQDSDKEKKQRQHSSTYSFGAVQFAPWGSEIVLVMPGIDGSAAYRFRASGEVQRVAIRLPDDLQVSGILGTDGKDTWVIRAISAQSAKTMEKVHLVENPQEFLYEVNPRTGEILRGLDVSGPNPGEVACAADGKLATIYVGDSDRFVFATATR
jgi:hypothetical protein